MTQVLNILSILWNNMNNNSAPRRMLNDLTGELAHRTDHRAFSGAGKTRSVRTPAVPNAELLDAEC